MEGASVAEGLQGKHYMKKSRRKHNASGRTVGAGGHVRLYHWLLATPAWRSLSCEARAVLVELYALYNGSNNGGLFLSVREAAKRVGIGKTTAARALDQLADRGFIRRHVQGGFSHKIRHATQWVLTEFPHGCQLPTKDFAHWKAASENQNTVLPEGQMVPLQVQMTRAAQ